MNEKSTSTEHQEILKNHGIDKVKFYEKSSTLTGNIFTTCVFINSQKNRIEARGVSICSLRDAFNRKDGKNRAFGRAIQALNRKQSSKRIRGLARQNEVVEKLYKVKTQEEDTQFRQTVVEELIKFDPDTNVIIINGQGSKVLRKYLVKIPAHYPIYEANKLYRYKSHYRPNPACSEEYAFLDK